MKIGAETFWSKFPEGEHLRLVLTDEIKEIDLDDPNILWKLLQLTKEEIESITTGNLVKKPVYEENSIYYQDSIFQDLESFRSVKLLEGECISFNSHEKNSNYFTDLYH